MQTKTEIARDFVDEFYGNVEKKNCSEIARKLFAAKPGDFGTCKSAENAVQYSVNGRKKSEKSINILIIGDLHAPFTKKGYLEFCKGIYKKYNCTDVIFTGDILDNNFSSFHEVDPDGDGANEELRQAKEIIKEYHTAFPIAKVCIGNHDRIPDRKRFSAGLSASWIKTIDEVLDVQGWVFAEEFVINGVLYTHGECRKARLRAIQEFTSVVQGHYHSESYYEVFVSESRMIFALQVGSGVDRHSYAMAYGKHFKKPQINVGVVMDNGRWAILEHMKL
jgi:predicted phosphodiesterase